MLLVHYNYFSLHQDFEYKTIAKHAEEWCLKNKKPITVWYFSDIPEELEIIICVWKDTDANRWKIETRSLPYI